MSKRKYLYMSNKDYDGTVYQTQIIDWIHLYDQFGIKFDLVQLFHFRSHSNIFKTKKQIHEIKIHTKLYSGFLYLLPSYKVLCLFNALLLYVTFIKYIFRYKEILVFSRGMYGRELKILKKIFPLRILYYYDARGAGAEEYKYNSMKSNSLTPKRMKDINDFFELEKYTVESADKVFVVSTKLKNYFIENTDCSETNFIVFPCLSDATKFYYDESIHKEMRVKMGISEKEKLFIYAGGMNNSWHMTDILFNFFEYLASNWSETRFLLLSKDNFDIQEKLNTHPRLKDKLFFLSVDNELIFRYYNAADYGILFRENSIMNNVASPSKYAEYLLCGLPVIISEGVGDYSDFTTEKKVGYLIHEEVLNDFSLFDIQKLKSLNLDRKQISTIGRAFLTKETIIPEVIRALRS